MTSFPEYDQYDGLGLADLIRRGELPAEAVLEAALARIEARNPGLNAVIHRMDDEARATVRARPAGPLAGVPFLIKDLLTLHAGVPYRAGSRFLEGYVPDHDSEVMRRYRRAGLVTIGKTNTPEFGLTPFTEPALFGPAHNPWDPTRTTGGSSGGSAAAVASRMVPIAGGGDGGGSIRIPASCCGVFGLKPTRGRVPTGPDVGELWQGAVVEHAITRTVRDSAAVLDAIAGPDLGAPYFAPPPERPFATEVGVAPPSLRIGWTTEPWLGESVDPDCEAAVQDAVTLLTGLGHRVVPAGPTIEGRAFSRAFVTMLCGELQGDLRTAEREVGRRGRRRDFEPATWVLSQLGNALSAGDFSAAVRELERQARRIAGFFQDYDLLLTPTLAVPPFPIGALQPSAVQRFVLEVAGWLRAGRVLKAVGFVDQLAREVFQAIPYTVPFNVTGQPAMSVPLHWTRAGLPIGVHVVARYGDEATLFQVAGQLERERPWTGRAGWDRAGSAPTH